MSKNDESPRERDSFAGFHQSPLVPVGERGKRNITIPIELSNRLPLSPKNQWRLDADRPGGVTLGQPDLKDSRTAKPRIQGGYQLRGKPPAPTEWELRRPRFNEILPLRLVPISKLDDGRGLKQDSIYFFIYCPPGTSAV